MGQTNAMTVAGAAVLDPPSTYTVDPTPLFNNATQQCIEPSTPCTDVGNACGNSCETPQRGHLPGAGGGAHAALPALPAAQQRPGQRVPERGGHPAEGTSVCMGGTCGD
jgi:hypothetical protein